MEPIEFSDQDPAHCNASQCKCIDSGQQYSNSVNFTLPANYSQPLYVYVISNYPGETRLPSRSAW